MGKELRLAARSTDIDDDDHHHHYHHHYYHYQHRAATVENPDA